MINNNIYETEKTQINQKVTEILQKASEIWKLFFNSTE